MNELPKLPQREEEILKKAMEIMGLAKEILAGKMMCVTAQSEIQTVIDDAEEIANCIINAVYPEDPVIANKVAESYGIEPIPLEDA